MSIVGLANCIFFANAHGGIPEQPNLVTLLFNRFQDTVWAPYLYLWENIFFSVLAALFISFIFILAARKKELVPTGLQNFVEGIVEFTRKSIVEILGPEGEKYVPFLGTLFLYILCMNLFGLVPLLKAPSSSLNITIAQAIVVFILVQYLNIKNQGLGGFLYHLAGSPKNAVGWMMAPMLFPIELLTQVSRPVTLALRLFGNMFGEHVLIGYFAFIGLLILPHIIPTGVPLQIPFMFLGLLTALMQALVFTLLTTVYILLSSPSSEEHD